jgi:hypothetical protein
MMLRPAHAADLIAQTCGQGTILVGGQAVAFWSAYFGIRSRLPALTKDIDFLATRHDAKRAAAQLRLPHKLKLATLEDPPPNIAVLSVRLSGYPEPVLIDFLSGVVGLDSKDIVRSAVVVEIDKVRLAIMHPLQLLQAKLWNLYRLPVKRSPEGVEQARLSIGIAAGFIERQRRDGASQRELLEMVERVGRFAATAPARYARDEQGLECLEAVPESILEKGVLPAAFHEKRWPQILAACR